MYTDPQIHTLDGKGYGQGNMGQRGIEKFIDSHVCNDICRLLKLIPITTPNGNGGAAQGAAGTGGRRQGHAKNAPGADEHIIEYAR